MVTSKNPPIARHKQKKRRFISLCQAVSFCLSKTRRCCVSCITHQARERFPGSRCPLHVISSPGQPVAPRVSHTPAVHPHHCICVRAPVYDEHKKDCHPQSCVWVKKIYIFSEVWIRCISFGRNPSKEPATEKKTKKQNLFNVSERHCGPNTREVKVGGRV